MNGKNEILHKYLHSTFTNMTAMVSTVKGANGVGNAWLFVVGSQIVYPLNPERN